MEKRIFVDSEKCNGCGLCQVICAVEKAKFYDPSLSRIKVKKTWLAPSLLDAGGSLSFPYVNQKALTLFNPIVCSHCEVPACRSSCLMNIIVKDNTTGINTRDETKCIGCRACQVSCPFDACTYDHLTGKIISCDLCEGSPSCIDVCPTGALQFEIVALQPDDKRKAAARSLMTDGGFL